MQRVGVRIPLAVQNTVYHPSVYMGKYGKLFYNNNTCHASDSSTLWQVVFFKQYHMIYVIGYRDKMPPNSIIINTTSRSKDWSQGLSPFILEGGHLYGNYHAKNVENAWQYSKVYEEHVEGYHITEKYWKWAENGWNKTYPERYPMGKGTKPLFSLWDGKRLGKIEARKEIYMPIYGRAVEKSDAFKGLLEVCELANKTNTDIYLLDFDGYNHIELGMTFEQVISNPDKSLGHAFVIWNLLKTKYDLI